LIRAQAFVMFSAGREDPDQRGVSMFVERIDRNAPAGVRQRVDSFALRELGQNGGVHLPEPLSLAGTPLLIAKAAGQVDAFEKLSSKERGGALQLLRRRVGGSADRADVEGHVRSLKFDAIAR